MLENIHPILAVLREKGWSRLYPVGRTRITVGMSTCGRASGAEEVFDTFEQALRDGDYEIDLVEVGCEGLCWAEPIVEVQISGWARAVFGEIVPSDVPVILNGISNGILPMKKCIGIRYRDWCDTYNKWINLSEQGENNIEGHSYIASQSKRISAMWGHVQPWSIEEYAGMGGYTALDKAIYHHTPDEIIQEVAKSGLRGRGGAGYPTGKKWKTVHDAPGEERYLIANADEGDPGAYMDRGLLESNPYLLLEGMTIAGYAIGAAKGYIFTRSEYPLAVQILQKAINQAREWGTLGKGILGSNIDFDIYIIRSAGAYVCGEGTAMIAAIEGEIPDPHPRPPHSSEQGLWGCPTCINNVETYANIPTIVSGGARLYREVGTEASPGTKIFSLVGAISHPGLIEVPMGMSLVDMVDELGGREYYRKEELEDLTDMRQAVQVGGPSGAILPLDHPGLTLDYEGLQAAGGIMGSGGIVVLGNQSCVVDIARYFLHFSARESCGKCIACRDGLAYCCLIMDRVVSGDATQEDIDNLRELCDYIANNSLCGLGKMAPTPVISSLEYFSDIYNAHIKGHCPSLVCRDLMHFEIQTEKCLPSCLSCLPSCPADAIIGHYGVAFRINQELCTKCWMCSAQCPYDALRALPYPYRQNEEQG